jgi:histidinol dehydrogenase
VEEIVRGIIADVQARGDSALLELSRRFDYAEMTTLEVSAEEWAGAAEQISPEMKRVVQEAAQNIRAFHERQKKGSWLEAEPEKITGQLVRPLARVGVYVPGGTAAYPSSVLMTAIPAKVAGVEEVILATPVREGGKVPPLVLYAAQVAGVERVITVGGAQAVAAFAFGTETVPQVDKVVGPGNVFVNVAKKMLYGVVDIDMLAGPSEVCVLADAGANPLFAAMDLLTQAEHDVECAAYLITPSEAFAEKVLAEIERQLQVLPRSGILKEALEQNGGVIITESLEQAYHLANVCAPEHIALMVREPFAALGHICNAGAILMGDYSPQTLGDYLAGPSHTLPTSGTARFSSPLHVDTFLKKQSFIYYTPKALSGVAEALTSFARAEGFDAHAEAVVAREKGAL